MLAFILSIAFLIAPVICGSIPSSTKSPLVISEEPLDVQNHPNLGLLPTKHCGFMNSKLIGGNETRLDEVGWMVLISYNAGGKNRLSCVGTLINERYVLTAAQCVTFIGNMSINGVIVGEHDVRNDPDCEYDAGDKICADKVLNITVEEIIPHPSYNRKTFSDDIALIRLAQPVDFKKDTVSPICLPFTSKLQSESLTDQNHGDILGWGLGRKIEFPVLSKFAAAIISNADCQVAYNSFRTHNPTHITNRHLCIKNGSNFGGDAGGPLIVTGDIDEGSYRHVQRGVVSFGPRLRGNDNLKCTQM